MKGFTENVLVRALGRTLWRLRAWIFIIGMVTAAELGTLWFAGYLMASAFLAVLHSEITKIRGGK